MIVVRHRLACLARRRARHRRRRAAPGAGLSQAPDPAGGRLHRRRHHRFRGAAARRAAAAFARASVIVENKPGANGAIAADYVAKSEADGYTLFFTTVGAVAINPCLAQRPALRSAQGFRAGRHGGVQLDHAGRQCGDEGQLRQRARRAGAKAKPGDVTIGITGRRRDLASRPAAVPGGGRESRFQAVPYRGSVAGRSPIMLGGHARRTDRRRADRA